MGFGLSGFSQNCFSEVSAMDREAKVPFCCECDLVRTYAVPYLNVWCTVDLKNSMVLYLFQKLFVKSFIGFLRANKQVH